MSLPPSIKQMLVHPAGTGCVLLDMLESTQLVLETTSRVPKNPPRGRKQSRD